MNRLSFLLLLLLCIVCGSWASEAKIQHFDASQGFSQPVISCAIQDREGFVWLSSTDGLWRYDGHRFENFKARPGDHCPLENNRLTYVSASADEGMLICKSNDEYFSFSKHTGRFTRLGSGFTHTGKRYAATNALKARIRAINEFRDLWFHIVLIDRQNGIWVYSHRGLERVTFANDLMAPQKSSAEPEEFIRALYRDKAGRMWIADKNGYVRIVKGNTTLYLSASGQLTASRKPFGHNVYCFFEDHNGNYWLGSKPDGLFKLKPTGHDFSVTHFRHLPGNANSLSNDNVYQIAEDRFHRILVITYGGGLNIMQPSGNGYTFSYQGKGLSQPREMLNGKTMALVSGDKLLIGTTKGLLATRLLRDTHRMKFTSHHREPARASSLISDIINMILITRKGDIFLSTAGGIERFLTSDVLAPQLSFAHFSAREGLPADISLSMVEDANGHIWNVSESALCCLDPVRQMSVNYIRSTFQGWFVFSEAPPLCLPDGNICIGTTQGLLNVSPKGIGKSQFTPYIFVDQDSVIDLDANHNNLTIRYAALDMSQCERIVYAYKLEGIDSVWHFTENNELNYVALPPGKYMLHLKSTNGDGVWTNNERVIRITRHAAFNETPWAWLLYTMLAALAITLAVEIVRYIRHLQWEIRDIQLSSEEKMDILKGQLRDLLSIDEPATEIHHGPDNSLTAHERDFGERCRAYILDHISNADLTINDLALHMGVSRTKLYALIRKIFNTSPNNLLINMRIEYGGKLLRETGYNVSEVAYKSGFSDPKYFSRCFKRITGMRPNDIRGRR